jgi:hypothetical protein
VILSRVPAPVRDSHSENISDPPPLNLNEAAEEVKIGGGRNASRAMSSRRQADLGLPCWRGGCCVSPQVTFSERENPMTQRAEVLAPQFATLTNNSNAILVSMIPEDGLFGVSKNGTNNVFSRQSTNVFSRQSTNSSSVQAEKKWTPPLYRPHS